MNNLEKVSVIMSVYNSEKTIENSINSILNQTYNNIEFLIVDDSSTDETFKKLKLYSKVSNIKIFQNQENIGLTKSLNLLITKATGNYIARQDADDFSHKDRIRIQINKMIEKNIDFSTTRAEILNSQKVIPNISFYFPKLFLKFKNPFIHGSLIIKKDVLIKNGLYDERFYFAQDYKLMFDLINKGYKHKILKDVLYKLNSENNISSNFSDEQKYFADCVRKNKEPKLYQNENL